MTKEEFQKLMDKVVAAGLKKPGHPLWKQVDRLIERIMAAK